MNILVRILVIAGLFSQGLCFGYLCAGKPDVREAPDSTPDVQHLEIPEVVQIIEPEKRRNVINTLLRDGDYEAAFPHLRTLAALPESTRDHGLRLRLALCFEARFDFDRARDLYQVILQDSPDPALNAAARLGQARCHLQKGEVDSARRLLWRLCFPGRRQPGKTARGDALMWLAHSYNVYSEFKPIDLLERDVLIPVMVPVLDISRQLEIVAQSRKTATIDETDSITSAESPLAIVDLVRVNQTPTGIIASFHADQANLLKLFQWTAAKTELPFNITDQASDIASHQSVTLNMAGASLQTALDAQTAPFGLAWLEGPDGITVCSREELSPLEQQESAKAIALRLLDQFQIGQTRHDFVAYCQFQEAVIQALSGSGDSAVGIFRALRNQSLAEPLRQAVDFNLGQILRLMMREEESIAAYSRVADSNIGGMVHAMGYMKLGFMNLELGRHQLAAASFARSVLVCDDSVCQEIATIGQVSSYFLEGNVILASSIMDDSAHRFKDPDLARIASFLQAFFVAWQQNQNGPVSNQGILLETLTQAEWPDRWGSHGKFIQSMAFRVLGFEEVAVQYAIQSLNSARGSWLRRQILVQLTHTTRDREMLQRLLLESTRSDESPERGFVLIRMAEIDLEDDILDRCETLCRRVLGDSDLQPFHSRGLQLLGNVFDKKGEHYHAAICYSGLMPDIGETKSKSGSPKNGELP